MCVLEAGTRIMGKTGNVKVKASVFETNYRLHATICDERAQTPPPSPTLRRKFFRRFSPQNPGFCSFCSARGGSAAGGDGGFAAAGRKDERLRPPGGRTVGPTISLGRHSRHGASAPRRKCGVRRREPVGRATGVYSIKRGPHCAARSGEQRDGAAWRYQRKIAGAQKHFCPPEAEMCPGTPPSQVKLPP